MPSPPTYNPANKNAYMISDDVPRGLVPPGGWHGPRFAWPCLADATPQGKNESVETQSKRKTCRRYNDPGHAHALTFSCFQRQPFFMPDRVRHWLMEGVELARERHQLDLWAFVIMPEHVHLLIYPRGDDYDISRILSTIKPPVSRRAIDFVEREAPGFLSRMTDLQPNGKTAHRFWQRGGGYDRHLWSPRHIWETIAYVHANPVRRGLCNLDTDWPWSSARAYAESCPTPMPIDSGSLPDDPRRVNAIP